MSEPSVRGWELLLSPLCPPDRYGLGMVYSPTMKITSTTDLEFPGLNFSIRQGEVKDLPDDPEAAAFILAGVSIQEVPEPEARPRGRPPDVLPDFGSPCGVHWHCHPRVPFYQRTASRNR
jgi:hypothetical protein